MKGEEQQHVIAEAAGALLDVLRLDASNWSHLEVPTRQEKTKGKMGLEG